MSFSRLASILCAAALLRVGSSQPTQFNGTIAVDSDVTNIITITVANEGIHNYSILAKNNMFDNSHPFAPFTVQTSAGTPVTLAGTRFDYHTLSDSQFMSFPPATVWTRQFNVSEFLLPDAKLAVGASECFIISLPDYVPAILVDNMLPTQKLADLFFSEGLVEVPMESIPLHHNVSDPAGASTIQTLTYGATSTGGTALNETVPLQPAGSTSAQSKAIS